MVLPYSAVFFTGFLCLRRLSYSATCAYSAAPADGVFVGISVYATP